MIFWMEIGSSWNDTRGLSIPSYKKLAWLLDQKHDEIYTQRPKPIFGKEIFQRIIKKKFPTTQWTIIKFFSVGSGNTNHWEIRDQWKESKTEEFLVAHDMLKGLRKF